MAHVLSVGTATLDIVYTLDRYPEEDEEMRARGLRVSRGGNAANTAVVMAQLGHQSSFLGVLADAPETSVIEQDFLDHSVNFSFCPKVAGRPPTSSIYLSGPARTIVHYRDLPELNALQFEQLPLDGIGWVHFEGRNVAELQQMLARVRKHQPEARVSIELEKPREGIASLWQSADVLICSRGFAVHYGHDEPEAFLKWLRTQAPEAVLVLAWGKQGAFGMTMDGEFLHGVARPPEKVVDSLGAGDVFNAAVVSELVAGKALHDALETGCFLAGKKCGVDGLGVLDTQT